MIGRLTGVYSDGVIDVNGVGYAVEYDGDQEESAVFHIHTIVKEDSMTLWAFDTAAEKSAFGALIGVRGVGPGRAAAILATIGVAGVYSGDKTTIATTKGVGPKMAETIVRELKVPADYVVVFEHSETVKAALVGMGYGAREVAAAMTAADLKDETVNQAIVKVTSILSEA